MLTEAERELIQAAFSCGPAVFIESGMSPQEYDAFIQRPEVIAELELLNQEFRASDALAARQQWIALRKISRMAPDATDILRRALQGPQWLKSADGKLATDDKGRLIAIQAAPTSMQFEAALQVLERISATRTRDKLSGNDMTVDGLFQQAAKHNAVVIGYSPDVTSPKDQAFSREKRRKAILKMLPKLTGDLTLVDKYFGKPVKHVKSKVVKNGKAVKKTASKPSQEKASGGNAGTPEKPV